MWSVVKLVCWFVIGHHKGSCWSTVGLMHSHYPFAAWWPLQWMLWVGWLQPLNVTCYVVTVHRPLSCRSSVYTWIITCIQYTYSVHSFSCINCYCVSVLVFFQIYVLLQLQNIRTLCIFMGINTECFGKPTLTHPYVCIVAWRVLKPLWYLYCTFSIYEPWFNNFAEPSTHTWLI